MFQAGNDTVTKLIDELQPVVKEAIDTAFQNLRKLNDSIQEAGSKFEAELRTTVDGIVQASITYLEQLREKSIVAGVDATLYLEICKDDLNRLRVEYSEIIETGIEQSMEVTKRQMNKTADEFNAMNNRISDYLIRVRDCLEQKESDQGACLGSIIGEITSDIFILPEKIAANMDNLRKCTESYVSMDSMSKFKSDTAADFQAKSNAIVAKATEYIDKLIKEEKKNG